MTTQTICHHLNIDTTRLLRSLSIEDCDAVQQIVLTIDTQDVFKVEVTMGVFQDAFHDIIENLDASNQPLENT